MEDYVTSTSRTFFEIIDIKTDFFEEKDVEKWEEYDSYNKAKMLCESLNVVNDSAERAVALGEKYNNFATTNEQEKQAVMVNVFNNRKKLKSLTKQNIIEQIS